eukprot:1157876-Pelagomonas_calceolata.AAC.4
MPVGTSAALKCTAAGGGSAHKLTPAYASNAHSCQVKARAASCMHLCMQEKCIECENLGGCMKGKKCAERERLRVTGESVLSARDHLCVTRVAVMHARQRITFTLIAVYTKKAQPRAHTYAHTPAALAVLCVLLPEPAVPAAAVLPSAAAPPVASPAALLSAAAAAPPAAPALVAAAHEVAARALPWVQLLHPQLASPPHPGHCEQA